MRETAVLVKKFKETEEKTIAQVAVHFFRGEEGMGLIQMTKKIGLPYIYLFQENSVVCNTTGGNIRDSTVQCEKWYECTLGERNAF